MQMILLWFTADTAAAVTIHLLLLFLDKNKDGAAYLLCIVEVRFLVPCNVRLNSYQSVVQQHVMW